jgi:hypothetical protein
MFLHGEIKKNQDVWNAYFKADPGSMFFKYFYKFVN